MAGPTITADLCWQITWFCPYDTLLELVRVSASTYHVTLPLLYNDITASHRATRLVNSLATNSALPKLVKILEIMAPPDVRLDPVQWAAVLPAMCNLRWLTVCSSVSFPAHILPSITFRLITFGSFSTVVGDWVQLIASQPSIEELLFVSDFYAAPPSPRELPNLRVLRGRPADIARFSMQHPLEDLWFFRGPPFERRRPKLLTSLQHIVLDEEETWTDFIAHPSSRMHGSSLETFAAAANHRFPNLESVLLASVQHHADPGRSRRLQPHLPFARAAPPQIPGIDTKLVGWIYVVRASQLVTWSIKFRFGRGQQCPHLDLQQGFCLLHNSGIVTVDVEFCGCNVLPRGVSPIWPPPASISSKRCSHAARKDTAPASLPTTEDTWQAAMAELSGFPSQWAKGELDDENFQLLPTASSVQSPPVESCDVDDEYVDMPPLMASPDCVAQCFDTPFEPSPQLLRLEEALQRTGRVDGETMERLSRETMELEAQESEFVRKFKLARRAWEEQELREREIAREAALAYVVAAMREPDRRRWVEDGHRQEAMEAREAMPGLRWIEEGHRREALAGRSPPMMGPGVRRSLDDIFDNPFERRGRARSPVLAGDVSQASWRDYSTGSGELEYVD
ncbi:hypothetical protein DFH06DRAFT_1320710 [Mycena polygramma]|nr:hypothetical protein DFH06DRAFT_1320710 [Mycena polygramma]